MPKGGDGVNIEQAAKRSGITAKMIRYYERIALIPKADRRPNGYRAYNEADVHRLRFIRRAHDVGFSLEKIGDLLDLWSNRERGGKKVKTLALGYLAELETRAAGLAAMKRMLSRLANACEADRRPDVPTLEDRTRVCRRSGRAR
jgi:MerR family copper efflux transcriptional regulator